MTEELMWSPPPVMLRARRSRRRSVLIVGLAVVVSIAGVGAVGWHLRSRSVSFTLNGRSVARPAAALSAAETDVTRLTSTALANRGPDGRCYFAVADGGSDVSQGIYCGPIALVDSATGANFLHYELTGNLQGGREAITVSTDPDGGQTQPLPVGYSLMRPGDSTRRRQFAPVTAPIPAAAAPDTLMTTDTIGSSANRLDDSHRPVLIGPAGNVELAELRTVDSAGAGTAERSAATGYQLIAFKLAFHDLIGDAADLRLTVTVDSGAARPVPMSSNDTDWHVLSIPRSAASAILTWPAAGSASGVDQSMSLLDGRVDTGELVQRANYVQTLKRDLVMPATFDVPGSDDGPTTLHFHLNQVALSNAVSMNDGSKVRPGNPKMMFLHVEMNYTDDKRAGKTFQELRSPLQELRLPNGTIIGAGNVSVDDGTFIAYVVPATFTTATLIFGGGVLHFADGGTEAFGQRVEIPINIPLAVHLS